MNNEKLDIEEEYYSITQRNIFLEALNLAITEFTSKNFYVPYPKNIDFFDIPENILFYLDNDTELQYVTLIEAENFTYKKENSMPSDIERKMGERLFDLGKNEFKKLIKKLEKKS